jgi:hypothetical protein
VLRGRRIEQGDQELKSENDEAEEQKIRRIVGFDPWHAEALRVLESTHPQDRSNKGLLIF